MYRHIIEYKLRYTDFDVYNKLKLSSLLSVMQESACLSADELGFGYEAVNAAELGFVVVNWYVELYRPVRLGETLTIHTWPLKPKMLIFLRDFEFYVGDEKVGVGTSRWCMVNLNTFVPTPVSAFFGDDFFENANTVRSINFTNWKIPQISDNRIVYSKDVKFSDCDHYFHVNNARYADLLLDVLSLDKFKNKWIESVQITYVKQCMGSECIDFYFDNIDGFTYIEGRVNGETRVQMKVKLSEV